MPSPKMKRLNKLHKIARANRNSVPVVEEEAPAPVVEKKAPAAKAKPAPMPATKPATKAAAKPAAKKPTKAKKATKTVKTDD